MKMIKKVISLYFLAVIIVSSSNAYARQDTRLYFRGINAARKGNLDFAFVKFDRLISLFPESKYSDKALFAVGEYYFLIADYYDAAQRFTQFVEKYPESEIKIFALLYLLEIARRKGNQDEVDRLEREIVTSQQLSLLFRDFKEYTYTSALSITYKAVYFIDKVEFYRDDKLFTEVFY